MIAVKDNNSMAFIDIKNIKSVKNIKLIEGRGENLEISFHNSMESLKIFGVTLEAFETLVGNCLEKPSDLHVLQASFIYC